MTDVITDAKLVEMLGWHGEDQDGEMRLLNPLGPIAATRIQSLTADLKRAKRGFEEIAKAKRDQGLEIDTIHLLQFFASETLKDISHD